jgi:phage portal protein BeeE
VKLDYKIGTLLESGDIEQMDCYFFELYTARFEFYEKAKKMGLLGTDEIRKLEGLPPRERL